MKAENEKLITAKIDTGDSVRVVRLTASEYGSLDTQGLARVRALILGHVENLAPSHLVVDLSAVQYLGASFIGILVAAWEQLRKGSRRLALCGLTPYCRRLILTLHLDKLFEIYPTQAIALEQFGQQTRNGDRVARGPGIRVEKSEVLWDPDMLRLEFIGDDNIPFRSIIVPRTEAGSSR